MKGLVIAFCIFTAVVILAAASLHFLETVDWSAFTSYLGGAKWGALIVIAFVLLTGVAIWEIQIYQSRRGGANAISLVALVVMIVLTIAVGSVAIVFDIGAVAYVRNRWASPAPEAVLTPAKQHEQDKARWAKAKSQLEELSDTYRFPPEKKALLDAYLAPLLEKKERIEKAVSVSADNYAELRDDVGELLSTVETGLEDVRKVASHSGVYPLREAEQRLEDLFKRIHSLEKGKYAVRQVQDLEDGANKALDLLKFYKKIKADSISDLVDLLDKLAEKIEKLTPVEEPERPDPGARAPGSGLSRSGASDSGGARVPSSDPAGTAAGAPVLPALEISSVELMGNRVRITGVGFTNGFDTGVKVAGSPMAVETISSDTIIAQMPVSSPGTSVSIRVSRLSDVSVASMPLVIPGPASSGAAAGRATPPSSAGADPASSARPSDDWEAREDEFYTFNTGKKRAQGATVYFNLRDADGVWFPDSDTLPALQDEDVKGAEDNDEAGGRFKVMVTARPEGDLGCTTDGLLYIKVSLVKKYWTNSDDGNVMVAVSTMPETYASPRGMELKKLTTYYPK